jgi:hypothetical protein
MAGYCKTIHVVLNKDGSCSVLDDGRGIPVEINKQYKKSALEIPQKSKPSSLALFFIKAVGLSFCKKV